MTTTTTVRHPVAEFAEKTLLDHAAAFIAAAFVAIRRKHRVAIARRHLNEMPDYILKDLGISRSQIEAVTAEGVGDAGRRVRPYGHFGG